MSVAVVSAAGFPLALLRADRTRLQSPDAGGATAAIARIPTIDLQGAVIETLALLSFRGRMPLTGGEPLIHDGGVVGGVGSSNGEPADDAAICTAAGKAFAELT